MLKRTFSLELWLALLMGLLFIAANLFFRPIFPIDETRYISVAWEMWVSDSWLVPFKNGEAYSHKPPLLFWLLGGAWSLFGATESVTYLTVPLCALANLLLVRKLALVLYPDKLQVADFAPLILLSFLGWYLYSGMIMFDLLLSVFFLLAMLATFSFLSTHKPRYLYLGALAIGLGMLAKGPVILLFWVMGIVAIKMTRVGTTSINKLDVKALLLMVFLGVLVILLWAVPAAFVGGESYAKEIFWGQSAGRMKDSFAHARPFYWYLMLLPVLIFPWAFLVGFWRSKPWLNNNSSDRFCLLLIALTLAIFSCFSGKQPHYVMPVLPFLAIWIANKVDSKRHIEPIIVFFCAFISVAILTSPWWSGYVFRSVEVAKTQPFWTVLALFAVWATLEKKVPFLVAQRMLVNLCAMMLSLVALLGCLSPVLHQVYDVKPAALEIKKLQDAGHDLAYVGKYHNTFGFAGRLEKPLVEFRGNRQQLHEALANEFDYLILLKRRPAEELQQLALFQTSYRSKQLLIVEGRAYEAYLDDNTAQSVAFK